MDSTAPVRERELERFEGFLSLLARLHFAPSLQGKVDLSGLVKQTLLEAHQAVDLLRAWDESQRSTGLRETLTHNLTDEMRKLWTAGRDVAREQPLEAAPERSPARLETWLAADRSTPSQRAVRQTQLLRVAEALARLSMHQRTAVELHHLRDYAAAEVARQMGRDDGAVGALLVRGLEKLRGQLRETESG